MSAKKDDKKKIKETEIDETVNQQPDSAEESHSEKEPSELDKLKEENAALSDKYLRILAEYDNFRKRSQKERDAIYPEAVASAVEKILPVMDNIDRALAADCSDAEFKKGIELIKQSFDDALSKLGISEIKAMGEQFDPNFHNAVMHVEDDSAEENTIVEVFQKGYVLGDRVVRFAMVKVAN